MSDAKLLEAFVEAWSKLDEMLEFPELNPTAHALRRGKPGRFGECWRPRRVHVSSRALTRLYLRLPHRLPALYELLVMSYRWAVVDIRTCTLLANAPGPGLTGLEQEMFLDRGLTDTLIPNGFVPFARASGGHYDPVCFATFRASGSRDCPVVRLDHEAILCHRQIRQVSQIAPTFRELVLHTVAGAAA
jgi:hypothetical protein